MLEKLFISVLNMSVVGNFAIVFVLIARLLLKKTPKIFSYALWGIVLFRLLCPFSFESVLSLMPMAKSPIPQDIIYSTSPQINTGVGIIDNAINPLLPMQGNVVNSVNPIQIWILIGSVIWVLGMLAMLIYSVAAFVKLRQSLIGATRLKENIYLADHISSPFVMGLFRPKIYLPSSLSENEMDFVIAHELCHVRRFDHVTRILGFAALAIHWFNPLVWIAFILSGKDMELSCDEAVMKKMDTDIRGEYSQSLLRFGTAKGMIHATPLAFGEGDTKERVKNVLNYQKPAFWIVAVALVAVVAIGIGLAANPKEKSAELDVAQTLWDARTEYVGNNAAVGNILGLLEFPDSLTYQFFALQTDGDERGVELHFIQDTIRALTDLETWQLDKNALLFFALIGNLEDVRCSVADKEGGNVVLHQTRAWADKVVEGDIRDYGESAKKLQELLQYTAAAAPAEYTMTKHEQNANALAENRELTKDEIDRVNEAFETLLPTGDGDAVTMTSSDGDFTLNQSSHFFTSYYETPSRMDMGKFVYYMPRESYLTVKDAAEIEALKKAGLQLPFEHIEDSPVPFGRIPFATVEEYLQKYMNISLADMTNMGNALYLKEYETFYSYASDFGPGVFQCTSGQTNGNLVTLYSDIEHTELTLRKEGESYFIFSHVPSAKQ